MPKVSAIPEWRSAQDIEVMQTALLREMIDVCSKRHPWYRPILAGAGLDGSDIRATADLTRLPLTTKQTFIDNSGSFRLEPDPLRPEDHVLADVTYTAGTSSGTPTPIFQTNYDIRAILFAQRRMTDLRGMTRDDRVVNLYPLAPFPHGGWIRPTQAAAALGAPVVAATGGSSHDRFPVTRRMHEIVALVVHTDPTIVWGVPSYVERVLTQIADVAGRLPSLRMIAVSGEPCSDTRRETMIRLAEAVGARAPTVSDSLGASELQFSLVECAEGRGFHHPAPELAHIGVVDEAGNPVPDGRAGRLVYTHLDRTGTVLLRFLVGDRAILDRSPCPDCGWVGGRIVEHLGREGNLKKIRGALVNVDAVHQAIEATAGVADHRLEIEMQDGVDVLRAVIATAGSPGQEAIRASVSSAVHKATGVRPDVTLATLEQIWSPDEQMKPSRFVDHRTTTTDGSNHP